MAVKDYKTNPDENTTISGINIAEGCAPSGINNAIRQLMADVRSDHDAQEGTNTELAKVMTGATASDAGESGNVPAPAAGQHEYILRGDGTWVEKANIAINADNALNANVAQYNKNGDDLSLLLPAGAIVPFGTNYTPEGYLHCDGSLVSRTTYARLFSKIGVNFGNGDGSTTFALPNIMDKTIEGGQYSGIYFSSGLPEIEASLYFDVSNSGASGAFSPSLGGSGKQVSASTVASSSNGAVFKASSYNNIYGKSNKVQTDAITLRFCIKY